MEYFTSPHIVYLEDTDFNSKYQLFSNVRHPQRKTQYFTDVYVVVLVQGTYCGYCNQFKPVFQQIAEQNSPRLQFATIQIDGKSSGEKIFQSDALSSIIQQPLKGVPLVLVFYNGQITSQYSGDRSYNDFSQYIHQF